ncbi:PQQ-like beta-propeller repeat protein [Rubripirellula sp.]|nr:PQQ-binding-like beta-propeller repeat protein [Planctomycetaceae bacterium]MDA9857976.1 PQQ-like beta-propeller repeat protein [Rubripirellula sp.]
MRRCFCCLMICLLASGLSVRGEENDWPTFRGADRTGVAPDTGLLDQWPEGGPTLLWEIDGMGRGYSSPAIARGQVFILGDGLSTTEDSDEYLICVNRADGKELWRFKTGEPWEKKGPESWQSSRSTATVDGDRVYTLTAFGQLYCLNTKTGEEVWKRHLKDDLDGNKADSWGYSESVTIDGEKLICTPGGGSNTLIALNKLNGELIWNCANPDDIGAGHASVVISEIAGNKIYVQTTGSGAMGVQASDGKLLWTYGIPKTTAVIPTPIVRDDLVFFTAGYGLGGALLKQVPNNDGGVDIEEIYPNSPALQNKHGGVVLVGDYLYGDSGDSGTPYCAELMTGDIAWKSRGSGRKSASVVAADGKIFVRYSNGVMTMVNASPEEFTEKGSFKTPGSGERPSWAHPVIADGKLYLREGDKLLCYDLRK